MNAIGRFLLPLASLFLICSIAVLLLSDTLQHNYIDGRLLFEANVLFFLISMISFFIQRKGLQNKNPNVFVRAVMGAMMFKMIMCILAVIAYVYLSGDSYNKRGIFIALFLYLVYLATEVYVIMKMNKQQKKDV